MPDGRKLIGASFRGVPFFVESHSRGGGGRRTITHEFYGASEPEIGDAGRGAVTYQISGYVLGENYIAHRDALIIALEGTAGPGELIHPYLGTLRAQCSSLNVSESTIDGGIATFSLTFADAPDRPAPTEIPDLSGELRTAAAAALSANSSELVASYDVAGQPSFAKESLSAELTAVASKLLEKLSDVSWEILDGSSKVLDRARVVEDRLSLTVQELATVTAKINSIVAEAATLISSPADMLDRISETITDLASAIENAPTVLATALLDTYAEPAQDQAIGTSSTRDAERANQTALGDAIRRLLVIEAVKLLPDANFTSTDQADDMRNTALDAMDALLLTAGNDAYPSLVLLRASVVRAVPGDAVLARVQTITKKIEVPSLLLTYQLYGDVSKEQSVIDQNSIQHPGFMSGDIKVLSDV